MIASIRGERKDEESRSKTAAMIPKSRQYALGYLTMHAREETYARISR